MVYSDLCGLFFFFKQKTAYEMRISDWSSDVCSSDLGRRFGSVWTAGRELSRRFRHHLEPGRQRQHGGRYAGVPYSCWYWWWPVHGGQPHRFLLPATGCGCERQHAAQRGIATRRALFPDGRSEEHTSELQSLMRISYAVFCLKKKTKQ